jgi:uncharacterized OB-fold protein
VIERTARPDAVRHVGGDLPVRHRYTPGLAGEAFFTALRDRGVIVGSRCRTCAYTYVPARSFCERCFAELAPDVEVGPGGELVSFTIAFVGVDGDPLGVPRTFGLVRLDGGDAVMLHRVLDPPEDEPLEVGERVEVVLLPEAERTGSILDIAGFRITE